MKKLTIFAAATVALTTALSGCGDGGASGGEAEATAELEVFSWWTSGSEDEALQTLISAYEKDNPDVNVSNGAVAGGGGGNSQQVLKTRIQGGNPPDVFQTHPAESLKEFTDANAVVDLSDVYAENDYEQNVPADMTEAHKGPDGGLYGISIGAHRGNVLWYSKPVLEKAGVAEPSQDYAPDQFLADLKTIKDKGETPLCLGSLDTFAIAELYENILLGEVGPEKWTQLTSGEAPWDSPDVTKASKTFLEAMEYADADHSAMTWDQAAKKLGDGECAFNSMGDFEYGELVKNGASEEEDFGYVPQPGSSGTFILVVDTFAVAEGAKNEVNAKNFARELTKPEVALEFNKIKGSTPIRTDVDVSSLPAYQQAAADSYSHDDLVWSIAHGQATTPAFQQSFFDGVVQLASNGNVEEFQSALTAAQQ